MRFPKCGISVSSSDPPFLWFNDNAEEAVEFYKSIFKKSKIGKIARYDEASEKAAGRQAGSVMTIEFEIEGQKFIALNGGPHFKFNEAISLSVDCKSQAEVDELWEKLSAGGSKSQCAWLKDKFGLSWQIVPSRLVELMQDPDPAKSKRVVEAMMQMTKIDIAKLEAAHAGR